MKYSIQRCLVLLLAFIPISLFGQSTWTPSWETANGKPCGTAASFAEHNNNTYVATYGAGVFVKRPADLTWWTINSGLGNLFVNSIAVSPDGVIIAATRGGLFKTNGNNESWTKCDVGVDMETFDFVHSTSLGVLYASGGSNLFRSTDGGNSWTIAAVLLNTYVNQIAEYTNETLLMSTLTGMFYSTNSGVSWAALPQVSQSTRGVVVDKDKHVFIIVNYKLAQATFDGNEAFDWTICSLMEPQNVTSIALTNDSKVFVGTDRDGAYLMTDTTHVMHFGFNNVSVTALPAHLSANKYIGYNTGIYKLDNSYSVSPLSGLPNLNVDKVIVAPNSDLYAILPQNRVSCSTDGGLTWSPAGENQAGSALDACIVAPDGNLVAGTEWALTRSTDKGASWVAAYSTNEYLGIKSIIKRASGDLVAVGYESVYISSDNGASWSVAFSMPGVGFLPRAVAESSSGILYALLDNTVARSAGDISSWEDIAIPEGLGEIYDMVVFDGKIVIVCANIAYTFDESTQAWAPLFPAIDNESWINSIIKLDEKYFVSMHNGALYLLTTQPTMWNRINSPEFVIPVNSSSLANHYEVYVATAGYGILKARFLYMPAEDTQRENGLSVGPCPARDFLKISLPEGSGNVPEIKIVNISGERMAVGVEFDASGMFATVDCSKLSAGVYCCIVGNGAAQSTEKIIIVR